MRCGLIITRSVNIPTNGGLRQQFKWTRFTSSTVQTTVTLTVDGLSFQICSSWGRGSRGQTSLTDKTHTAGFQHTSATRTAARALHEEPIKVEEDVNALCAIENAVCRRVGWLLLVVFIFWCFAIFRVCRVDGSADQRMFCSSSVCFVSRLSLVAIESRLCSSYSRDLGLRFC